MRLIKKMCDERKGVYYKSNIRGEGTKKKVNY